MGMLGGLRPPNTPIYSISAAIFKEPLIPCPKGHVKPLKLRGGGIRPWLVILYDVMP